MATDKQSGFGYVVGIIVIGIVMLISKVINYKNIYDILYLIAVIITIIRCVIIKISNRKLYR